MKLLYLQINSSVLNISSMAIYNTSSNAANTMVRAFLTKIVESYLNYSFNTGSEKWRILN